MDADSFRLFETRLTELVEDEKGGFRNFKAWIHSFGRSVTVKGCMDRRRARFDHALIELWRSFGLKQQVSPHLDRLWEALGDQGRWPWNYYAVVLIPWIDNDLYRYYSTWCGYVNEARRICLKLARETMDEQ